MSGYLKKVEKDLTEYWVNEQTNRLVEYAKEELEKMVTTHTFKNRTKNLEDSYAWGVYYKGELKESGFRAKSASKPAKFHGTNIWGNEEAVTFIQNGYTPPSNGWVVVWVAAAPYSVYLDPKSSYQSRSNHFFVISQRYDAIRQTFGEKAVTFSP